MTFSDEIEVGPDNSRKSYLDVAPVAPETLGGMPLPDMPEPRIMEQYEQYRQEAESQTAHMANLLHEYQRLLMAYPFVKARNFTIHSDPVLLAQEIATIKELASKPMHYEMYDMMWGTFASVYEGVIASTPTGAALAPAPTPENPRPRSVGQALTSEKTLKKVRPLIDEIFSKYSFLKRVRDLDSAESQLMFVVLGASWATFKFNTDAEFRKDIQRMENAGAFI